ncbi:hypothetical protein Tco_0792604 [Tanacetum coccineum]
MANIRTCNKHNMIACVEKTAQNADFYQIIDFLTGCSINYSLLVDPDLIGPWLQQFWATATLKVINDVPHIRAKVAGKKILISEATIRADLLFDDENGVDCFPKQVIWDVLRDIGYEGNLAQLTFSKPLFVATLEGTWSCITSVCLVQRALHGNNLGSFNFYLNKQLEGVDRPQDFNHQFSLLPEVVTALAAEEEHSTSPSSRAASSARDAQGTAEIKESDDFQEAKETKKKHKKKCFSKMGRNKMKGTLSEEHNVQEKNTAHPFFDDIADSRCTS